MPVSPSLARLLAPRGGGRRFAPPWPPLDRLGTRREARPSTAILIACLLAHPVEPAGAANRVDVTLSLAAPQIRGRIETTFTNTSAVPLPELVFMLFPNRFATPDAGINDANRPFVYPSEDFDPGGIEVGKVRVAGEAAATAPLEGVGLPADWGMRVPLPSPLPPGGSIAVSLDFATRLPLRFGSFGHFEDMLTALGGWYPYAPPLRADGSWAVSELPPVADFDVRLAAETPLEVLLNGSYGAVGSEPVEIDVAGVHVLTLVAAPSFLRQEIAVGDRRILYYRRPSVLSDRQAPGPSLLEIKREALAEIVAERPAGVPPPRRDLVVVEAPLRLDLTAPGEGMAVISDRSFEVLWLLRPFHEAQVAQGVYAELLRPRLAGREPSGDYPWVSEGLSYEMARRYYEREYAETRSVQSWIELFNVFAIVDRFETVPKIPFVGAFFERQPSADPLHERITTWASDLPPGHVVLGKLHLVDGDEVFARVVDGCSAGDVAFRECAATMSGRDLDVFFAQWLQPYPRLNYSFAEVELNDDGGPLPDPPPLAQGRGIDGEEYVDRVTVRRESSRPIHEPVPVRLRSIGGESIDLRWDGTGDSTTLTARAPFRVQQAVIDPERKLIETTRVDNADPPEFQLILDTAEVEVSSTEFGISGLAVARARYDYRKDIAAAGLYTNRGIGMTVGPRYHWGEEIDPAAFRNNIYFFYAVAALDRTFHDDRNPGVLTAGHVNGIGVRYDYDNIYSYDNPTREIQLQLYTDWYDEKLGGNYSFVDWGGSLVLTHPLWSNRTILAGEIANGFSEPLDGSVVPNQNLYSLGGSRSIRGIGAEVELGRNIFLLRGELRQTLEPELDLNLLDLLILRRLQVRGFVDTGQVSNSAGAIYDPSQFSLGFGIGFGAFYDFMGFFPSLAYFEVATSTDHPGDVQFLFGTRQAF